MRGRWLLVGLIASLALNVFLIGAAAGVVALGQRMAGQNAAARPGVLVRATAGLPQPDRHDIRMLLRQAWMNVRPDVARSRALSLDAWTSLADPKADAQVIKLKLAQSRQLDIAARAQVEQAFVDAALRLPPADRTIIADGLRQALPPAPPLPPGAPPAQH